MKSPSYPKQTYWWNNSLKQLWVLADTMSLNKTEKINSTCYTISQLIVSETTNGTRLTDVSTEEGEEVERLIDFIESPLIIHSM